MSKQLVYAEDAIFALDALFVKQIKQFGYDSYEKADEKTQLVCDGISESIGCLLNMPSAQPEDIARDIATIIENEKDMRVILDHQWIPVSERLPEEGQNCLVCIDGVIGIDVYLGHGGAYDWECRVSHYDAWMPLPEPYKGEQE